MMGTSHHQTTLLIGGSNATATLCAILGDRSKPQNANHTLRICTRSPHRFATSDHVPIQWTCHEQKPLSDLVPNSMLPTTWTSHVGQPDSVYDYSKDDDDDDDAQYNAMERAISGIDSQDDGGQVDLILLCCPVNAHLPILKRVARALYRLNQDRILLPSPPLVIGTLYGAGGFDWMSRIAFSTEKPKTFTGQWSRPLALFALKAFPYLCKSTQVGVVTLYGRYPNLLGALCPSTPRMRAHVKILMERVLQTQDTGKHLEFLGISSRVGGGDGSAVDAVSAQQAAAFVAASSGSAWRKDKKKNGAMNNATVVAREGLLPLTYNTAQMSGPPCNVLTMPMADHADLNGAIAFLTCTLNATNQLLHPCILVALFHDPVNPAASDADGTIPWDDTKEKTPFPRFYADGAAKPEAGRLITDIGAAEFCPVMDCLDAILAPTGMSPICSQHGGEPVGRFLLNESGNSPRDIAQRSGLTDMVLWKQKHELQGKGGVADTVRKTSNKSIFEPATGDRKKLVKYRSFFSWAMGYGLRRNSRLGSVLAPAIVLPNEDDKKAVRRIKPNVNTRFFADDLPYGLCIVLGLAELLGFDLERDMPETLYVVRKLQRWMGKEYVVPVTGDGKTCIVANARDLGETLAPQAFGVKTVPDLQHFLKMSPFAENLQQKAEEKLIQSPLISKL